MSKGRHRKRPVKRQVKLLTLWTCFGLNIVFAFAATHAIGLAAALSGLGFAVAGLILNITKLYPVETSDMDPGT